MQTGRINNRGIECKRNSK